MSGNVKLGELRIGNWVEIAGVFIHMDVRMFHAVIHGFEGYDPKPIPLTEDWLIRFGFKKDFIDSNYYLDGSRIYPIYKRGIHFNINGLLSCCKDFHFVHQLQNLYFALTGEELKIKEA